MVNVVNPYAKPIGGFLPTRGADPLSGVDPRSAPPAAPRETVTLGAPNWVNDAAAAPDEDKTPMTVGERLGNAVLMATTALAGFSAIATSPVAGLIMHPPSLSQPVTVDTSQGETPSVSATATPAEPQGTTVAAPATAEKKSADVHIITNIDATEPVIEPFATSDLGQLQQTTKNDAGHITVDVGISRESHPLEKIALGGGVVAISAAPYLLSKKLRKNKKGAAALAITMAGLAGSYVVGSQLGFMHDGVGKIVSGISDLQHEEGVWSGHREMHMENGQRTAVGTPSDKTKMDPAQLSNFLAEHMQKYPSGTTVVHLFGHGLMYRHTSGMSGEQFPRMIADATSKAGRPIDVLVLESCLQGNIETLSSVYPHVRYAIVSEESINAGATGRVLEKTATALAGQEVTPREFATTMLAAEKGESGIQTYAVIDMAEIPHVDTALDRLGQHLTAEVKAGRTAGILAAVDKTQMYPVDENTTAKKLSIGDLKMFAKGLLEQYKDGGAGASSPEAATVRADAQAVLDSLDKAVIGSNMTDSYSGAGGVSVQLPGMKVGDLEKKADVLGARGISSYAKADSPSHWREFVDTMSQAAADSANH